MVSGPCSNHQQQWGLQACWRMRDALLCLPIGKSNQMCAVFVVCVCCACPTTSLTANRFCVCVCACAFVLIKIYSSIYQSQLSISRHGRKHPVTAFPLSVSSGTTANWTVLMLKTLRISQSYVQSLFGVFLPSLSSKGAVNTFLMLQFTHTHTYIDKQADHLWERDQWYHLCPSLEEEEEVTGKCSALISLV